MAGNTNNSPNPKPDSSYGSRDLTPQEIELLRQDKIQSHQHSLEFFRKMGVKQLYGLNRPKTK